MIKSCLPLYSSTGTLSWFILRKDRINVLAWLLGLISLTVVVAAVFPGMFPTELEKQVVAETMKNPAMIAMIGPVYGADNHTVGAMTGNFMLLFTALGAMAMNIVFVPPHT